MAGLNAGRAARPYFENCAPYGAIRNRVPIPAYHCQAIAPNDDCFTKRGASDKSLLRFYSCATCRPKHRDIRKGHDFTYLICNTL